MTDAINNLNQSLEGTTTGLCCVKCRAVREQLRDLLSELDRQCAINDGADSGSMTATLCRCNHRDMTLTEILREIGKPANLAGYRYLRYAILMVLDDADVVRAMTTVLYPSVAKHFDTTRTRVERSIRHAIEVAWEQGDMETQQKYFGNTVSASKGRPTTGEFIFTIADQLRIGGH